MKASLRIVLNILPDMFACRIVDLKYSLIKLRNAIGFPIFLIRNLNKERFTCPLCGYCGPFKDTNPSGRGLRKHAKCPKCDAAERHRLEYLIVNNLLNEIDSSVLKMVHFSPERCLKEFFVGRFGKYDTADLNMRCVDYRRVDLTKLPFADQTYDFVFVSSVLEYISDDEKAISEIRRILKPRGIAILNVPIIAEKTVEYPEPNAWHVRWAAGLDYFDRCNRYFSRVDKVSSDSFPSKYQLFIYENRTQGPAKEYALPLSIRGEKRIEVVAVCHV